MISTINEYQQKRYFFELIGNFRFFFGGEISPWRHPTNFFAMEGNTPNMLTDVFSTLVMLDRTRPWISSTFFWAFQERKKPFGKIIMEICLALIYPPVKNFRWDWDSEVEKPRKTRPSNHIVLQNVCRNNELEVFPHME